MGMAQCPHVSEVNGQRCGLGPDHKGNCQFPTVVPPAKEVKALIYVFSEEKYPQFMTADKAGEICDPMTTEEIVVALNRGVEYLKDRDELQHTLDLRWKADMRAIKLWQKKTGRKLSWPDHCDMVVWLLEQLDEAKKKKK
jgi:hypothetical protein